MADLDAVRSFCLTTLNAWAPSGLMLTDREDTIAVWLEAHGVTTASAEDLARTPLTIEALDRLGCVLQGKTLDAALRWIAAGCAMQSLVMDLERATTRIHEVVDAVKGYTHLDRALVQEPVDVLRGLVDTVALLDGKAKEKSVELTVSVPPDIPAISGISVEVNQIWMNLIDNAIDAAPPHGHVSVMAAKENTSVVVTVLDDGLGIAPDIRERIFDPFFTTKQVGEGTGLGLDIVRRIVQWHAGEIEVDSRPGHTEFRVRLPAAGR